MALITWDEKYSRKTALDINSNGNNYVVDYTGLKVA